jgi:hypothetical protein
MSDPLSTATTATYVSATTFTLSGDHTVECHAGRRVRAKLDGSNRAHGNISSSSYSGVTELTTVILTDDSESLTSELVGIWLGAISAPSGGDSSIPIHDHSDEENGGDWLSDGITWTA